MKAWNGRHPVVVVPTKYYTTPTQHFHDLGISTVIWANHNLRASIEAMQRIAHKIFHEESLINVENCIATVEEVFQLQRAGELQAAEGKYLPSPGKSVGDPS